MKGGKVTLLGKQWNRRRRSANFNFFSQLPLSSLRFFILEKTRQITAESDENLWNFEWKTYSIKGQRKKGKNKPIKKNMGNRMQLFSSTSLTSTTSHTLLLSFHFLWHKRGEKRWTREQGGGGEGRMGRSHDSWLFVRKQKILSWRCFSFLSRVRERVVLRSWAQQHWWLYDQKSSSLDSTQFVFLPSLAKLPYSASAFFLFLCVTL